MADIKNESHETSDPALSSSLSLDEANRILNLASNLLICNTCGTQYPYEDRSNLQSCFICNDPRQYVPPSGQSFTTLSALRDSNHVNHHEVLSFPSPNSPSGEKGTDPRFYTITTTPKFAIGQRAFLIRTSKGNVLWDCITYLDLNTISFIQSLGGLAGIVISHPHFYSSNLLWATVFRCPVYTSHEDTKWLLKFPESLWTSSEEPSEIIKLMVDTASRYRKFLENIEYTLPIPGVDSPIKALKLGGHFPGSLVLLAHSRLLIADTLMTTPAGLGDWSNIPSSNPERRPYEMNSYAFMWSIPNMIPLSAKEMDQMWNTLKEYDFGSTHGGFAGMEVVDGMGGSAKSVKVRVRESMLMQRWSVEEGDGEGGRLTKRRGKNEQEKLNDK